VRERICSAEGCEAAARARGLCNMHYCRARASGLLIPQPRKPARLAAPGQRACSVPECGRPHLARGLCTTHYGRALRLGQLPALPGQLEIRIDQHVLENIDLEMEAADCLQCGPRARIRIRPGRGAECRRSANHRGRQARTPQARRQKRLRRLYKLAPGDYDRMLAAQGGVCAICRREPPYKLFIDHCHTTGRVRGLLCAPCNTGLGFLHDSQERALRAAAYLA